MNKCQDSFYKSIINKEVNIELIDNKFQTKVKLIAYDRYTIVVEYAGQLHLVTKTAIIYIALDKAQSDSTGQYLIESAKPKVFVKKKRV